MPRAYEMSYEGPPAWRWVKMYKGERYRVTCEELRAMVFTKEGSGKLANEWWRKKLATLEGRHPVVEAFLATSREDDELRQREEELAKAHKELRDLKADRDSLTMQILADAGAEADADLPRLYAEIAMEERALAGVEADEMGRQAEAKTTPPREVAYYIDPADPAVLQVLAISKTLPNDRAIGPLAARWTASKAEEATKGIRSPAGADVDRVTLSHFVTFSKPTTPAEAIDFDLWRRWYVHCRGELASREAGRLGWSAEYGKKVFRVARAFVRWLWESGVVATLPRNLDSKTYRFDAEDKSPAAFSREEVKAFLDGAEGQHKLHLLLMLNCGMTQKDISDLRHDEIDLDAGTITRRRSKTRRKKSTPLVRYPLWPETLRLLKSYLSADPVAALLTDAGTRWVRESVRPDGKLRKSDGIAARFFRLRARLGVVAPAKSLKVFRKTSATMLKSSKDYRDLRYFFLGHSARSVADRHYAAESQALLAEAIAWLGKQYGLA